MIANFLKKMYNIICNEREDDLMNLKPFNSQISIFMSDGIMNPLRLVDEINKTFNNTFTKENYSLNLEDAPNDMPLVRYSSTDGKYIYDFAKKRINFYLNFSENETIDIFETFKSNVKKTLEEIILKYSSLSRIGIAINYYIDKNDEKHSFWVKKFNFPFYDSNNTSEVSYTINNNFINKGLKYNKIIILSDAKIKATKIVPIVSVDINNLPTAKLSSDSIDFIFNNTDYYKKENLESFLDSESQ